MECNDVQSQLTAYDDNELESGEQQTIERHLSECENCATIHKRLRQAWNALSVLPQAESDPFAWNRFANRTKKTSSLFSAKTWYGLAASFVMVLGLRLWLALPPQDSFTPSALSSVLSEYTNGDSSSVSSVNEVSDLELTSDDSVLHEQMFDLSSLNKEATP